MNNFIASDTGLIHFIAGVFSLIFGTTILFLKKGTKLHKQLGYVYTASMIVLLVTAFMIYRLFDGWAIFHYAALISSITLLIGIIPPIFLRHKKYWVNIHFNAMYWSVLGLWAAFLAEMSVRIPETTFYWMVGLAFGLTMLVGAIVFGIYKKKWRNEFSNYNRKKNE